MSHEMMSIPRLPSSLLSLLVLRKDVLAQTWYNLDGSARMSGATISARGRSVLVLTLVVQ